MGLRCGNTQQWWNSLPSRTPIVVEADRQFNASLDRQARTDSQELRLAGRVLRVLSSFHRALRDGNILKALGAIIIAAARVLAVSPASFEKKESLVPQIPEYGNLLK